MFEANAGAMGVAFLVALALVPLLVRFAIGRDLLDVPNARSSHEILTPRLGGLAVIAGVWAALPFLSFGFLATATLAGLVGMLDDLVDLKFWMKAAGQAVTAIWRDLDSGGRKRIQLHGWDSGWDSNPECPFPGGTRWSVGVGAELATLAAAVAGFMMWNISPARIFLGDSGCYFVGFFLGAVALYTESVGGPGVPYGGPYLAFMVAAVFVPFLCDTAFSLMRRVVARKNIFSAHREHIYQRITLDPAKHRQVSNVYFALSALSGLAAVLASGGTPARLFGGGVLRLSCCLFMVFLPRIAGKMD